MRYVLFLVIFIVLLSLYLQIQKNENFQNKEADDMNVHYTLLIDYVQRNPSKSIDFIKSIQSKFCTENIDFKTLSKSSGPVFK